MFVFDSNSGFGLTENKVNNIQGIENSEKEMSVDKEELMKQARLLRSEAAWNLFGSLFRVSGSRKKGK